MTTVSKSYNASYICYKFVKMQFKILSCHLKHEKSEKQQEKKESVEMISPETSVASLEIIRKLHSMDFLTAEAVTVRLVINL